jgi:hypothetical protein
MWRAPLQVIFVGKVKETGKVCLNNAYVLLHETAKL